MDKRKFAIGIIILFIGMGIAPGVTSTLNKGVFASKSETIEFIQDFSEPVIIDNVEFIELYVKEINSFMTYDEAPMMPVFSKTLEFPLGTKVTDVKVTPSKVKTMYVEKQVKPVPSKQKTDDTIVTTATTFNQDVYTSSEPYPGEWCRYTTGAGLNKNNDHVLFLSLHIYPARYIPLENSIQYIRQVEVSIKYEEQELITISDMYDLVIIAPFEFSDNLEPLIHHKNSYSLETNLVILEDIYANFPGRDEAEKIKYFVKYAVEEWDTHYVLLVGDIKKLPIRTTYASMWEPDILSDLYYADIYDENGSFCSWDTNENNLFGEVSFEGGFPPQMINIDGVDLYADVHIGRISCTNENELDIVVNKIINYEKETYDQIWFKKIILAGGDTFPVANGAPPFVFEGEITNKKVAEQLPDFTHVKLWASKRNLNAITFNIAITKGAGFVSYSGHGFEHGWGTYRPNAISKKRMIIYYSPFIMGLKNNHKLPVVFFDACLTTKLDFTIADLEEYFPNFVKFLLIFTKIEDDPSVFYPCFAWWFLKKENGGAIATIGATRTAYTWVDNDGVYAGAGYLNVQFFKAYEEGVTAGEMLTYAQNDYINNVWEDYFTIEEFLLLGDPSLMIGGYS
ncbi:MAG: hypothetical protein JSW06_10560 [Thermoplasmatales archaeon]|nr:MAG: hypothetical protein JSW06_10560 [Thermoplasmatales archaeon]